MTVRVPTRSGITKPVPGRKTTGFASTTCSCLRRRPTGWLRPASTSMCAAGKSPPTTSRFGRSSRSTLLEEAVEHAPGQLVVHAEADDVIVGTGVLVDRHAGRRGEVGFVLKPDVEIFDLRRPVRGELDLDAAAGGPAQVPMLLRQRKARDAARDVAERAAGRGVEQPVVLRVADPAAERRKPAILCIVAEGTVGGKFECPPAARRGIGLVAEHDVAFLKVEPGGDPEAAEIRARGRIGPDRVIGHDRAAPGAAAPARGIGAAPGSYRFKRRLVDWLDAEISRRG